VRCDSNSRGAARPLSAEQVPKLIDTFTAVMLVICAATLVLIAKYRWHLM
jgi:hypothetical protein